MDIVRGHHGPCAVLKNSPFFAKEILGYGTSPDARRRVKRNVRLQGRQKNAIGQMGSCHIMPCHAMSCHLGTSSFPEIRRGSERMCPMSSDPWIVDGMEC